MKLKIIEKASKKKLPAINFEYFICARSHKIFKTCELVKNRQPGTPKKTQKAYAVIEERPDLNFILTIEGEPPPAGNRHVFKSYKTFEDLCK